MIRLLLRFHLFLARHRLAAGIGLVLLAGGALWIGSRLKLDEDFTDMLPLADPTIAEQFEAIKLFPQANRMYFDVGLSVDSPEQLARAADELHAALIQIPGLQDVRYRFDEAEFRDVFQEMQSQLPVLLTSNDLQAIERRLDPAALAKRLEWFKNAMSQPQGLVLKDLLRTDPVGLSDTLGNRWQALRAGFGEARLREGRVTSTDGHHILLSATPAFPASDRKNSAILLEAVLKAAHAVESRFAAGALYVAVTGAHRVTLDNAALIEHDAMLTCSLAAICVVGFIWFVYRRLGIALLTLAPPLIGGLGGLAVLYLFGDSVSAIVLGCGSILIGITDDYGNHMLYHTEEARHQGPQALAQKAADLVLPLTCSALVTMAAFLVLVFSPVAGHRQVGLFSASGVVFAAFFAIVLLPGFIPAGVKEVAEPLPLTALVRRVFQWRDRHARLLLTLLALWTGVAALGWLRLRFDGDINHLNGVTVETRRDEETLKAAWGQILGQTVILVTAPSQEEALRKNEAVHSVLENLMVQHGIQSYSSIAPLWPSAAARESRARAWHAFWNEPRRGALSNALSSAALRLGFRTGVFEPFLASLNATEVARPFTADTNPASHRWFADYVKESGGQVTICTLAKVSDMEAYQRLREAVRAVEPGAKFLNKSALAGRITQLARNGLVVFAVLVVAVNALLLFLLLGRVDLVLVTLLPIIAAILWTLGTLGLCGVSINVSNCIFVIFIVGVGIDYSLFLVTAKLAPLQGLPDRLASTGGSVTVCAFTTWLGIGLLVLARHPALFSVGLTAMLGMTFSLVATLFLVPTCMDWLVQRVPRGRTIVTGSQSRINAQTLRRWVAKFYRYQGPYVEQFVFWKLRTDPMFEFLDEAVPRRARIVDLGCGYGLAAHWLTLASPERTVAGFDHDAKKIKVARATACSRPDLAFEQSDLLAVPEYPLCDCVLLLDVLHYFPRGLKMEILRKASQCLHPGGLLVIRDACREDSGRHRAVDWGERWAVWTGQNKTAHGLHFETAEEHFALLRSAGFVEPEVRKEAGLGSNALLIARKARSCGAVARSV